MNFRTQDEATQLVADYEAKYGERAPTQQILDDGCIPALKGFKVRSGKVCDLIVGGRSTYIDPVTKQYISIQNPPLTDNSGVPVMLQVRTNRISTHDTNRGEIPLKAQIITANHNEMHDLLQGTLGSSQYDVNGISRTPVILSEKLRMFPLEMILRAYNAVTTTSTSLYTHHRAGIRKFCGHILPEELHPYGKLPYILDTPSTKGALDESLPEHELISRGLCDGSAYRQIRNMSLTAFVRAQEVLEKRGIILADAKFELGTDSNGNIVGADEYLTLETARFWNGLDYADQVKIQATGVISELDPIDYSKEYARRIAEGNDPFTEAQRMRIAAHYLVSVEHVLGHRFEPTMKPHHELVIEGLRLAMPYVTTKPRSVKV